MCGRSSLTKTEKELEERFRATFYSEDLERYNPLPNYNVAPTHLHPVLTLETPHEFHLYRWGLIPSWAKDMKIGAKMINARLETIEEKPAFRQALSKRRCLVPFDGYYEWQKTSGGIKIPYRIKLRQPEIFSIAGLYETWKGPGQKIIHSFTLITREADPRITHIHDRMPFILDPDHEMLWIDSGLPVKELLQLPPVDGKSFEWYRVSDRVNRVTENDPGLVEPAA